MAFDLKFKGTLGGAFPPINAVLSVGDLLVPIIGLLQPVIAFFEILVAITKFALFIALLPLLAIAFLVKLLVDAIKSVFSGIAAILNAFKNVDLSTAFSKYKFHGKVGHFGTAATTYFAAGIPQSEPPNPTQDVFGVFFIAVGTAAVSGLGQIFGPAPAMPPPTPPAPRAPNSLGQSVNGSDPPKPQLILQGGHTVASWTNSRAEKDAQGQPTRAFYSFEIHDKGTPAVPADVAIALGGASNQATKTDGTPNPDHAEVHALAPFTSIDVRESGISHSWNLGVLPIPMVVGNSYILRVMLWDQDPTDPGATMLDSLDSDPVTFAAADLPSGPIIPAGPVDGPLAVPVSSEITFLERSAFHLAFGALGGIANFITGLEAPLNAFNKLIDQTVGRFIKEKDAIEAMMQQWSDWIDGLHDQVTFLQDLVAQFGAFSVHFGPAFSVGEIWLYRYEGPVDGLGAAMTAALAAGLPDGTGPEQVIDCQFSLAEDPANKAILKFVTGG